MSDPITQTPSPDGESTAPTTTEQAQSQIPYARFKEVNDQLQALRKQVEQQDAKAKQSREAELAEQGKYKDLLSQREAELSQERAARLREQVAREKGLIGDLAPLAERLQGEDASSLAADADRLLSLIDQGRQARVGAGIPPAAAGQRPQVADLTTMTPAQIRAAWKDGKVPLK